VKLKVFYATDGDCLLLTSRDGRHALIDGGRSGSFQDQTWPHLRALGEPLDLVVVSHIDADHITGILWLMQRVSDWTVFRFQRDNGNTTIKEPRFPEPPEIKALWHNSWRAQVGALAEEIEMFVGRVGDGVENAAIDVKGLSPEGHKAITVFQDLAESIPHGIELLRTVDESTPVVRNAGFKQRLVMLRNPLHVEPLGTTSLTVIGPMKKHLDKLQEEWRTWLNTKAGRDAAAADLPTRRDAQGPALPVTGLDFVEARTAEREEGAQLIAALDKQAQILRGDKSKAVTPPNRASITLLAEEDGRTCLLTGDAAEEELLDGLKAAGRIKDGRCRVDVLKVQHHGSEFNLSEEFAGTVLADHYVFCADGGNENPDPSVVKTVAETRLAKDSTPFTLWFNCSVTRTPDNKRAALRAALDEAAAAASAHPEVTVRVLADDQPFFEIEV
jgi:beta-lactamase superfamily II metal-dependent hydrolase